MLSDPIDLKIYLTDAEFRHRVLHSSAWSKYLQLPPISPFDEAAASTGITQRNAIRAASHLPSLNVKQEITRLREHYKSKTFADRFYALASECVREIYGPITPRDFKSLSGMRWFFACKQNLIHGLIERSGLGKR